MRDISLYIADRLVDLDGESLILMNYTMEDLSNPTIVKNSYSKKINIKGTPNNNALFGDIWKADRKTLISTRYDGIRFDPTRRTPFQIFSTEGEILEAGYCKLDDIKMNDVSVEYSVTLYGGLGSFFYSLTYGTEGEKKTLADLTWAKHDGTDVNIQSGILDRFHVRSAWQYLENPDTFDWECANGTVWDIINFAPAYNGFPEDFDANKILDDRAFWYEPSSITDEDGVVWKKKTGCVGRLIVMANKHTEWEIGDLRSYLQRPVFSVVKFMDAITKPVNNGGFSVELDSVFFNDDNLAYLNGWITLTLCPKQNRNTSNALLAILRSSLTPCDYLISIAKMFGLVFLYDNAAKKVTITTRNEFYDKYRGDDDIDLSDRIDLSSDISITPLLMEAKWYQMGGNIKGEYASLYAADWGRPYGVQKINTGYEFDSQIKNLTKDIPLLEAADVAERNYCFAGYYRPVAFSWDEIFPVQLYENVEQQLYKDGGDDMQSFPLDRTFYNKAQAYGDVEYEDWLPKLQLHEADNKAFDGANVYVIFNGIKTTPHLSGPNRDVWYYLTDDHPDMDTLNSGKPCWNVMLDTGTIPEVKKLPSFRRTLPSGYASVEWGVPFERAVSDVNQDANYPHTLYSDWWKNYLADRYDMNAKKMKCKVNMKGLQVGQELLRRFWWFDNAIWVLNKIENYSITTDDLVDCEFIKVKDKKNYYEGQLLW